MTITSVRRVQHEALGNVLEEAGTSLSNVLKLNCCLADVRNFQALNEVFQHYFGESLVARTTVQIARLAGEYAVEMEVAKGGKRVDTNKRWGKVLWQEMTRPEFEEAVRERAMVIIPTGSTEQHGPHLPVSCDINNSYSIAVEVAKRVEDFRLIVSPPVWSGFSPHHIEFSGTISLNLHTFEDLMMEICKSIHRHGFRKVFILNGHGGNNAPLNSITQQLVQEKVYVATVTWWNLIPQELREIGESPLGGMSHACEAETSLQMLLQPEAVRLDARVKEIHPPLMSMAKNDFRESGPIAYGFDFKRQTQHGVYGDPTLATLEKGQRIFDATVSKLILALREYYAVEW